MNLSSYWFESQLEQHWESHSSMTTLRHIFYITQFPMCQMWQDHGIVIVEYSLCPIQFCQTIWNGYSTLSSVNSNDFVFQLFQIQID
jgi:hypothetical protein